MERREPTRLTFENLSLLGLDVHRVMVTGFAEFLENERFDPVAASSGRLVVPRATH
jgi:hypothetical protein